MQNWDKSFMYRTKLEYFFVFKFDFNNIMEIVFENSSHCVDIEKEMKLMSEI